MAPTPQQAHLVPRRQILRLTLTPWRKRRIDTVLAERGLFESRSRAAAAVLAGDVRLRDGRRAEKPGQLVAR